MTGNTAMMRPSARRCRAIVMYEGTAYQGFQRQKHGVPTIQAAIEAAILKVTGQAVTVIGAGRTDTGVHATGQVIAFDVEWKHLPIALLKAINAALPDDIAVQEMDILPEGDPFHPRFDAFSRVYRYDVLCTPHRQPLDRFRAWQFNHELNADKLAQAAAMLIGSHDFGAFGKPPIEGEHTIREVIRSEWAASPAAFGARWSYTVEANASLCSTWCGGWWVMAGLMWDVEHSQ
ncbi:MAG: tRNA pseudouridine synthase A [Anaerolineae bacterium]